MKNNQKYKKVFDQFYDSAINDERMLTIITRKDKTQGNSLRKWALITAAFIFIISGTTLVATATGLLDVTNIFRKGFDDKVSADLVEGGVVQELDIINETDDFILKLVALTGDRETQKVLFELTPKNELPVADEIRLMGQTFSPDIMKEGTYNNYGVTETTGYEFDYDDEKKTYYFSYKLPPFWIRDLDEDVVLRISAIKLYNRGTIQKYASCNLIYQFTPDRTILEQPLTIEVNQQVTKDVFETVGFTDDYGLGFTDPEDIVAPRTRRTLLIENVVFSRYKTEVKGIIMDENIRDMEARSVWNQFTEPRFITEHFWDGIDKKSHYNLVAVENEERIRLFVDNIEIDIYEDSLFILPGIVHQEGETQGLYGCVISFDGVDYDKARKIEIRFGDQIITIK